MARKGVAATLAAVALLTLLVVADATVMSAQDNVASSAQISSLESRELLVEQSAVGSLSLQVLAQVQGNLSSNSADCSTLPGYLESLRAASSLSGNDSGVEYSGSAKASTAPAAFASLPDNLTLVAPFAGYLPGALDLREVVNVTEGSGPVSLERHEVHHLNIPIAPASASSLCASSLGSLAAALSASPCNATLSQAAFEAVLPGLVEEAETRGFALSAGWGPGSAACTADYWVTLVEVGVAGPTGSFDWTVRGSGTAA